MVAKKVAVTGGLSSGKSTVCRFFLECGAYVVSADEIVHRLLTPDSDIGSKIIDIFGNDTVVNGQFDRAKIAEKAFTNPLLLQALEQLLHPVVRNEIEKEYQEHCKDYSLFVAEVPLLFETGSDADYEATIVVETPTKLSEERFLRKKRYSPHDYQQRMKRQMTSKQKASKATYVITNTGSLSDLKKSVETLYINLSTPNTGV